MPVIIPDVWSESCGVTRISQMNDERGALWEERRVLYREDCQFLTVQSGLAQMAERPMFDVLVAPEVLAGLVVRRAAGRPVPLDVGVVRLRAVGLVGAPDDSDYLVKHISTFLRLVADALIVLASLVVCRAAELAAPLDVVHVRLEAVGLVDAPDNADYFVKHISISFLWHALISVSGMLCSIYLL